MYSLLKERRYLVGLSAILGIALWMTADNSDSNPDNHSQENTATTRTKEGPSLRSDTERPIAVPSLETIQPALSSLELFPKPKDISDIDLSQLPEGTIAFERYTLDELRESEGFPAIDSELITREDFPSETSHQATDPQLHQVYQLDKELHRAKYLARHKIVERDRFWSRAQAETDPDTKALMLSSARYHARLAIKQQRLYASLLQQKADIAEGFLERGI